MKDRKGEKKGKGEGELKVIKKESWGEGENEVEEKQGEVRWKKN